MNNNDQETVEKLTRALYAEYRERWPGSLTYESDSRADGFREQAKRILRHLEDDSAWEYSIAFPEDEGWWNTDGVDIFESEDAAREDLERGGYLESDRVVRRRKAGPWVPVEVSS